MKIATRLRHLSQAANKVEAIQMRASEDLICSNLMCENVGDACVCKIARYLDALPKVRTIEIGHNNLGKLPDGLWGIR